MHGPDGTERPEERTDPLLPVITDSMPPPIVTPKLPRLDDRTLAELLAELDGEDFVPAEDDPPADGAPDRRSGAPADDSRPAPRTLASPGAGAELRPGRYVRREYRPPAAPVEAASLTGLTRRSGGRLGSIAFTVVFVAIFLLILVQAVVSVLDAGR